MAPLTITPKIASLKAQRQLSISSDALSRTYQRLSSGTRINSASDDAAGLAVVAKLKTDTRSLGQASRNISDGLSVLAVADGALGELTSVLSRLTELSAQSANGTYSAPQRKALDAEAQALSKEYTRIARSTTFNGQALFDSSYGKLGIAAGITGSTNSVVQSGLGGGIGDGTFQSTVSVAQGAGVTGLITADLNGDGIIDIAGGTDSNFIRINLGVGDGTFRDGGTFAHTGNSQDIRVADFNGDGVADLASSDITSSALSILIGNGNGTFAAAQSYTIGAASDAGLIIGDVNGDSKADILTADFDTDQVSLFLGNGDGTFASRVTITVGDGLSTVALGDYNGDGRVDFATGNLNGGGSISVAYGNGNGTFQTVFAIATGGIAANVVSADLNQDGISDFAISNYSTGNIQTYFGGRTGITAGPVSTPSATLGVFSFGDYDGDGNLDMLGSDFTNSRIAVLRGNGSGTFTPVVSLSASSQTFRALAADLNGDGAADIIAGSLGGQAVNIALGNRVDGIGALQPFSLLTRFDSLEALGQFNQALTRAAGQRGTIGAFQSRLEIAGNNALSTATNYAEAHSRISDADVASETADLLRLSILQQAGTAILAQANQQSSISLKLLGIN